MAVRDPDIWKEHTRADIRRIVLSFLNDADVRTAARLRWLIHRHRIDIFVPTRSRDYWLGGWAALGTRARFVMRMGTTRDLPDTMKERLRYGFFPDGIVVNAEAVRQSLVRYPWVKANRVRVIYNGVDTVCTKVVPPLKRAGEFLILAAGRVETDKGFDVLIEALALTVKRVPELRCVIFGRGDMERPLAHRIIELGLDQNVRFGGFTSALASALTQADLAVSSSRREGVSNYILEAWSAGVPVIATAIPGSAEIVTDGVRGRLVPPGEPVALAAAIVDTVEHPEKRAAWVAAGREAVAATFNWTTMAEQLEAFFEELLHAH
jgi:glycosyltransferase involved in cell wall biosynthesis